MLCFEIDPILTWHSTRRLKQKQVTNNVTELEYLKKVLACDLDQPVG